MLHLDSRHVLVGTGSSANRRLRVIRADAQAKLVHVIALTAKQTAVCETLSFAEVERSLASGELTLEVQLPIVATQPRDEQSAITREKLSLRRRVVQLLRKRLPDFLRGPETRAALFRDVTSKFSISEATARKIVAAFLRGGQTDASVMPGLHRCGRREMVARERILTGADRVRNAVAANTSHQTEALTDDDEANISRIISKHILTHSTDHKSFRKAYIELISHSYCTNWDAVANDDAMAELAVHYPTRDQFVTRCRTALRCPTGQKARFGDEQYQRKHRPVTQSPGRDVRAPGVVYQGDSTLVDAVVLAGHDFKGVPIGIRPTLYLLRDWFSTLFVGFALDLCRPCIELLGQALYCAAAPKLEVLARWGLKMPPQGWSVEGVPIGLLLDRGAENLSDSVDGWAEDHGIVMSTLPRRAPEMKGLVEIGMRQVHVEGIYGEPGAISREQIDEGLRRGLPTYTLPALRQLVLETLVDLNHSPIAPELIPDAARRAFGDQMTPQQVFDWGIGQHGMRATPHASDELAIRFLHSRFRSAQRSGFELNCAEYLPTVTPMETLLHHAKGKGYQYRLLEDSLAMDRLYLYHGPEHPLEPLILKPAYKHLAGLSLAEYAAIKEANKENKKKFDDGILASKVTSTIRKRTLREEQKSARRKERKAMLAKNRSDEGESPTPVTPAMPQANLPGDSPATVVSVLAKAPRLRMADLLAKQAGLRRDLH